MKFDESAEDFRPTVDEQEFIQGHLYMKKNARVCDDGFVGNHLYIAGRLADSTAGMSTVLISLVDGNRWADPGQTNPLSDWVDVTDKFVVTTT